MQEFEVDRFLKDNKWVSGAAIAGAGEDPRLQLDISPDGHGLIRDHGLVEFERRVLSRLPVSCIQENCCEIRSVHFEFRDSSVAARKETFPRILSRVDEFPQHRFLLDISPDLNWFQGHFPDNPILPGIVQLHWAVAISLDLFNFEEIPVEIKRLKFKNIVSPPRVLELALIKTGQNEVQFEFISLGQIHSLGRLVFEEGMAC